MATRLTPQERETTILWDESNDSAVITTADRRMLHRLARLGIVPDHEEREGDRIVSAEFTVSRSWIHVSPPRVATESQRESARRAMEALNAQRTEALQRPRRRRPARKDA